MIYVALCLLLSAVNITLAQHKTDYYALDYDYISSGATQNKSVEPCEDFKEFSLGNFLVQDTNDFITAVDDAYLTKLRKVLEESIDENDSQVAKKMKKFYAKCVSSDLVRQDSVSDMREYLEKFDLKLLPDDDQKGFAIAKYFEEQPFHAIESLLCTKLSRNQKRLQLEKVVNDQKSAEKYFSTIKNSLHAIFQINENGSDVVEIYEKGFNRIAESQKMFFEEIEEKISGDETAVSMTIDELNNLTLSLNLDWQKIIDSQLITKIDEDEKIYVKNPKMIGNLAEFLATSDKKKIANFLVYDLVSKHFDEQKENSAGSERWKECVEILAKNMNPALKFLYWSKYGDEIPLEPLEQLIEETKHYAIKVIRAKSRWEVEANQDLLDRVGAIKLIAGYPKQLLKNEKIDQLHSGLTLSDNLRFAKISMNIHNKKLLLEPTESEIRQVINKMSFDDHQFTYSPYDNTLIIPDRFLQYPFYHYQRTRFFNEATVANFFFMAVQEKIKTYMEKEHYVFSFDMFTDAIQLSYEAYDNWINSGEEKLPISANGLTTQQLYWMGAARVYFLKSQSGLSKEDKHNHKFLHRFFFMKRGFREAFHCKVLLGE